LYELGTQIILTSDRPPRETDLLERLITRLEASLITEIEPPDDTLRIAIIKNKARQLGVMLPDDITNVIAENMTANVRQLEGAVKMIIAYRDIMNDDITVDTVKERIKEMFKGTKVFLPTVDTIIEETANLYSLTPEDLKGPSKVRDIALARNVAIYLIRKLTNFSLKNIGNVFGGRDHSTILNSLRRIEEKIEESQEFSAIIKNITSNIHSKTQFYSEHSTYQQ
jgi:chromosomal replication initiator protein